MNLSWGRSTLHPEIPLLKAWKTNDGDDATEISRIGVYTIRNKVNHKVLVGRTSNLQRRYDVMKFLLDTNQFGLICPKLQLEYTHYGPNNFEFIVHELCSDLISTIGRFNHFKSFHMLKLKSEMKFYHLGKVSIDEVKTILREGGFIGK